jgi:hypothetical protein
MSTVIQRAVVRKDHQLRIGLALPEDFPLGEAEAIEDVRPLANVAKNRLRDISGKGSGEFWMAEDFDAPLDDFAAYR